MARTRECTENDHNDAVQLEVMSKEDSSWHPCRVSLCPSGVVLIVEYGNADEKETIVNKEDAFSRLRVCSLPLKGDDCTHIHEGNHVLATQKMQSNSLFFDAEIEKVLRVRHSNKIHCRCTFMINWLSKDIKGESLIVPSSSIMKLATESINVHPTISAFLNAMNTLCHSSRSPFSTFVEDTDCEVDLHEFLDKQIKDINNSADVSKKFTDKIMFDARVHVNGQIQYKEVPIDKGNESLGQVPCDQIQMKRTTRSRCELLTTLEVKNPPSNPSMQEELLEGRSLLSPLAARAALASLMSKLPQNLELSFCTEENGLAYASHFTAHQDANMESMTSIKCFNSSVMDKTSEMDKLSSEAQNASVAFISKPSNTLNPLFSTGSNSASSQFVDIYPTVPAQGMKYENVTTEGKVRQPKAVRVTRSAVHKGSRISNDDNNETFAEEVKSRSSTKRRLTRSGPHTRESSQPTETSRWMEENLSAKYIQSGSSNQHFQLHSALKDKKQDSEPLYPEIELEFTAERNKKNHIEGKSCSNGAKKLACTRRLTRSAAKETRNKRIMDEDNVLVQPVKSDLSEESISVTNFSELETKKPTSSQCDAKINSVSAKETKLSTTSKTRKNGEGSSSSSGNGQIVKRMSTTLKQELRFSPRLRSRSQTPSQQKC